MIKIKTSVTAKAINSSKSTFVDVSSIFPPQTISAGITLNIIRRWKIQQKHKKQKYCSRQFCTY